MYVLSPQEAELRTKLEHQVLTGFVLRGQALRSIKRLQLYRDRFEDFESYCESVFGFTMLYIERCMRAAETYYSIEEYLKTNSLSEPLPTKQSQLRPIFQAHLSPIEAGEVWVMSVALAAEKVPPKVVVEKAVRAYLQQKYPPINSFSEGEICRIKSGVLGKQNCWCVVAEVNQDECVVDTWDDRFVVSVDDLMPLKFTSDQSEQMLDLGERMTAIFESGELDEAAMWLLKGLEKLNRCQLNSLEERLLQVLEEVYLFQGIE
ncbi:MAG: hypothetical protein AAF298_09090 [Cyanobacteria bacterium P01_A01_bin.40]